MCALVRPNDNDKSHDRGELPERSMAQADLIAQTPRGSSIQKIEAGKFLVCDSENVCFFTRSLYLAEEQLDEVEDDKVLDYYEGALRLMENLMESVQKIPRQAEEGILLKSAVFLAKECEARVARSEKAVKQILKI